MPAYLMTECFQLTISLLQNQDYAVRRNCKSTLK